MSTLNSLFVVASDKSWIMCRKSSSLLILASASCGRSASRFGSSDWRKASIGLLEYVACTVVAGRIVFMRSRSMWCYSMSALEDRKICQHKQTTVEWETILAVPVSFIHARATAPRRRGEEVFNTAVLFVIFWPGLHPVVSQCVQCRY
ncbi:hypothetical protein OBBRIDRAFT_189446 [Obba rivulosa]|uniref:Uncharacterized protein n=1 Tax=Obba rivulosa TaxID=1052685 RepID=A0A8E2AMI0_9APHY|nr:hypothetical protein OBBRIDRAFT_189446 [Obba rivulosa]